MNNLNRIESPSEWVERTANNLSPSWGRRLSSKAKHEIHEAYKLPSGKGLVEPALRAAREPIYEALNAMKGSRLTLDAPDHEICRRADELAAITLDVSRILHQIKKVRAQMEHFVSSCGLVPPHEKIKDHGAIKRMSDPLWWRRGLRRMHATTVEGMAIKMGYVNKRGDIHVSNESVERRMEQNRRNKAAMEATVMVNELDQQFTLAELIAKSTANKEIRRAELMTRIAGFEVIAKGCNHAGTFLTVTCPSRMHKWSDMGKNGVHLNKKYDGTNPREAQEYLTKTFSKIRAKLHRMGIGIYGFRIAEPHHDGCPHWHILFFHKAGLRRRIVRVFRKYALTDSPDEAGAQQHRVKAIAIDWGKGSAAGYIAKYVAKNIDGLHVGTDLFGNPAMQTAMRVEAWAATWRIRQFQQIGGAPVGVWRELRRIKSIPESAPAHLQMAFDAVNKVEESDVLFEHAGEPRRVNWAKYVEAQGGVFIGRNAAIQLEKEQARELNKYGEDGYMKIIGVCTSGLETYRFGLIPDLVRLVHWVIKSARHKWTLLGFKGFAAGSSPPRTRVNNCTVENQRFSALDENIWRPAYCYG
jgi:hypothetical protein